MDERRQHARRDVLTDPERTRAADVFTEHQYFIESVARQHAPGPDHVPDIVQSVGLQVCRGLAGFREDSQIRTWLYRVTVNTSRDYYRRERSQVLRAREALATYPPVDQVEDPDDVVARRERRAALADAVAQLRNRTQQQAARDEMHGVPVKGDQRARGRRWRARQTLRTILDGDPRLE